MKTDPSALSKIGSRDAISGASMSASQAEYRGAIITETADGCIVTLGKKQFPCLDLNEAVALIDAALAPVLDLRPRTRAQLSAVETNRSRPGK